MEQTEELGQIVTWFSEQGLSPGASAEIQLCFLWRALQHTKSHLSSLTQTLDIQRSQYASEISEVRKSLEQIRVFTGHKDVLAREIQDENDQLRDQLSHIIYLQDARINEVAKMLYNQGLTELVHSSPSEQVAYLLVERASLLESSEDLGSAAANTASLNLLGTEKEAHTASACQTCQKRVLRYSQSAWKRLFGLHKTSQSKHVLFPAEARHLADQASSVQKECFRLERDLEEGSRRLAMAHTEIRRLTDELESAHLIQKAYEPELQAVQQEVEQLRQEVEQLKKYEMMGLRKAKELIDHLDLEIRALRSRVRALDAEKSSLQQKKQQQQERQFQTALVQTDQTSELNKEVEQLQRTLREQQVMSEEARELARSLRAELLQTNEVCRKSQNKLSVQMKGLLEKESEIQALKMELENKNIPQDPITTHSQLDNPFVDRQQMQSQPSQNQLSVQEDSVDCLKDECESLKKEICETLECLDQERSKFHEMKEKHKIKLWRAKQKLEDETKWRDEEIQNLEQELSLCSHALSKEKELTINITLENDKLLVERRRLLQQLNDEVHNKKDSPHSASLSKNRVDFLEMENKKLLNKILYLSNQIASLECSLNNMQSLHFSEERKQVYGPQRNFTLLPAQTSSLLLADLARIDRLLGSTETNLTKQTDVTPSAQCSSPPRSAEMGYLNLNSPQLESFLQH